jgi:hypothetical protein
MLNRFSPVSTYPSRLIVLAGLLTAILGIPAAIPLGAQADPRDTPPDTSPVPGVPNRPDLVTVVPFYWKPNETDREKTKAVIPADIDGHHSIFIVDIGCPPLMLNRTFLQPSAKGGVDTVTDANRIPDNIQENDFEHFNKVLVSNVHIGTLDIKVKDTTMHGPYNAYLGHEWGNFTWVFSPRMGNIGLSVLSQFETIIDYTHRRLILIRLDSAGHRMVDVPAYTQKWTTPLIEVDRWGNAWRAWAIKVRPDNTLDIVDTAKNTNTMMMDTGAPEDSEEALGYPFLSHLGAVGFNHRTHQFILYR